jgi:hypothetical protein
MTAKDINKNGLAMAALVAGGIGSLVLGINTLLSEASSAFGTAITFYSPAGALSGKTTIAVIVWLIAWFVMARLWKDKDVDFGKAVIASFVMLGLGVLFTLPPFFLLFGE